MDTKKDNFDTDIGAFKNLKLWRCKRARKTVMKKLFFNANLLILCAGDVTQIHHAGFLNQY